MRGIRQVRKFFFILSLFIVTQAVAQTSVESYFGDELSPEQLQEDFYILKTGLEKLHPSLYRYQTKGFMDDVFVQLRDELGKQMNVRDFYRKVCWVIAQIKCQHTVATPASGILNEIEKEGRFLPLGTFWEFDPVTAYVTYDFSFNGTLLPGTRIVSINGIPLESIYQKLIPYFPTDGNILTNKNARLMYGLELHLWYFLLIDDSDSFEVELQSPDNQILKRSFEAVTVKELVKNYKKYISQKDPELRDYFDHWKKWNKKNTSKPIRIEVLSEDIALLTVRNFHDHRFQKIIAGAFEELAEKQISNLIIDVRGNEGGSDIQGRFLFNHLIQKPTVYFDSLYTNKGIADTTFLFRHTDKNQDWYQENRPLVYELPDGRFATKSDVNEGLQQQQPLRNNFKGSVYVLMDGRSASTTAEFTAAAHFNTLATFIGEESGGAYHGGNGGDFAALDLPNSRISVQIPLSRYVMNASASKYQARGTLPDFEVVRTIQDVLNGKDPQLEFALRHIKEKQALPH